MERKMFSGLLILCLVLGLSAIVMAEMSSANYTIPTSVLSGGGAPMSSANYQANSTLGQSSPLMDPSDPPYSDGYDLYPGFWYTTEIALVDVCEGDFLSDGDVDGSDLAVFAADFGRTDCDTEPECEGDFNGNNDVDGSDLAKFAADFGRTDCLP